MKIRNSNRLAVVTTTALLTALVIAAPAAAHAAVPSESGVRAAADDVATFPTPLSAEDGELLTSDPQGCGTLTVTPSTPRLPETVTITLTGAPVTNTTVPVRVVPGVLVGDRWYSYFEAILRIERQQQENRPPDSTEPEIDLPDSLDDPTDGQIDTVPSYEDIDGGTTVFTPHEFSVAVGADGSGSLTFTFPPGSADGPEGIWYDYDLVFGYLFPSAWVAVCGPDDAVSSYVDVRPGRGSASQVLSLDLQKPGVLSVSGPANTLQIQALVVPMLPGLSPADSLWMHIFSGFDGATDDITELVTFAGNGNGNGLDGNVVSGQHRFDRLSPGRYALGVIAIEGVIEPEPSSSPTPEVTGDLGSTGQTASTFADLVAAAADDIIDPDLLRRIAASSAGIAPADHTDDEYWLHLAKGEWVLTVGTDRSLTLTRADGSDRSFVPGPQLAATGGQPAGGAALLAGVLLAMGLAIVTTRRRSVAR